MKFEERRALSCWNEELKRDELYHQLLRTAALITFGKRHPHLVPSLGRNLGAVNHSNSFRFVERSLPEGFCPIVVDLAFYSKTAYVRLPHLIGISRQSILCLAPYEVLEPRFFEVLKNQAVTPLADYIYCDRNGLWVGASREIFATLGVDVLIPPTVKQILHNESFTNPV